MSNWTSTPSPRKIPKYPTAKIPPTKPCPECHRPMRMSEGKFLCEKHGEPTRP